MQTQQQQQINAFDRVKQRQPGSTSKDVAVVRYKDEKLIPHEQPPGEELPVKDDKSLPVVKVVGETEFMEECRRRANAEYWKQVQCIQTTVKARIGLGEPIDVYFEAPIDAENPNNTMVYDYKQCGDEEILRFTDHRAYCRKQCLKICYYVQKVYCFDILRMKCEFLRDDNGKIWLFFVKDIWAREVKGGTVFWNQEYTSVVRENRALVRPAS